MYKHFGIDDNLIQLKDKVESRLSLQFDQLEKVKEFNQLKIIKAMQEKCLILCTRQIQKSIAASSYSLLVKIINEFKETLNLGQKEISFDLVYDLVHNLATIEEEINSSVFKFIPFSIIIPPSICLWNDLNLPKYLLSLS